MGLQLVQIGQLGQMDPGNEFTPWHIYVEDELPIKYKVNPITYVE